MPALVHGGATAMSIKRTFIAIEFPTELTRSLQGYLLALRTDLECQKLLRALRFVTPQNSHLTLRFLGDTTPEQLDSVRNRLQQLALAHKPFRLTFSGLGAFPNNRQPTVLWTDVRGDTEALNLLQRDVELLVQNSGFAAEKKPFHPHITLARVQRDASSAETGRLASWIEQMKQSTIVHDWSATLQVTQISYIESVLTPNGALYTLLDRVVVVGSR